jgi:hypothetical protein
MNGSVPFVIVIRGTAPKNTENKLFLSRKEDIKTYGI